MVENRLRAARPAHDFIGAKGDSGRAETLNLGGQIEHFQMHAVPATGRLVAPVRQRTLPRAAIAAEQQAHAVAYDRGKGWGGVLLQREAEKRRIEPQRSWDSSMM